MVVVTTWSSYCPWDRKKQRIKFRIIELKTWMRGPLAMKLRDWGGGTARLVQAGLSSEDHQGLGPSREACWWNGVGLWGCPRIGKTANSISSCYRKELPHPGGWSTVLGNADADGNKQGTGKKQRANRKEHHPFCFLPPSTVSLAPPIGSRQHSPWAKQQCG